jgi:hypothetical protein
MHLLATAAAAHAAYRAGVEVVQAHGQLQVALGFGQAPSRVSAELTPTPGGTRILLRGRSRGRTSMVLDGPEGPVVVPIAVGG